MPRQPKLVNILPQFCVADDSLQGAGKLRASPGRVNGDFFVTVVLREGFFRRIECLIFSAPGEKKDQRIPVTTSQTRLPITFDRNEKPRTPVRVTAIFKEKTPELPAEMLLQRMLTVADSMKHILRLEILQKPKEYPGFRVRVILKETGTKLENLVLIAGNSGMPTCLIPIHEGTADIPLLFNNPTTADLRPHNAQPDILDSGDLAHVDALLETARRPVRAEQKQAFQEWVRNSGKSASALKKK